MNVVPSLILLHCAACLALLVLRLLERIKCEYISILIAFLVPVWGTGMLLLRRISDRHRDRAAAALEVKHFQTEQTMQSISLEEKGAEAIPLNEALVVNNNLTRRKMMMDVLYEVNRSITHEPDETEDITTAADTDAAETSDTGTTAQTTERPADTSGTEPVSVKTEKRSVLPWILLGVGIGIAVCAAVSFSAYLILKKSSAAGIKKKTRNGKGK